MGEIIAVASGKGGTGKTSVTALLATALAQSGKRVLCIDCDVGLRNLDISLGLSDQCPLTFLDILAGGYPLSQATAHPEYPSLHFLTAPVNCHTDAVDPAEFSKMLTSARQKYQYIFLDAPAGIEAGFRLAAQFADRILLVTGPDPAAIRDATRASQVLEAMGKQNVRLIVNRINPKTLQAMGLTVDDIMDQAGRPLLGIVPEDGQVILAAAFKKPLLKATKRGAAGACKRIARRIQGFSQPLHL